MTGDKNKIVPFNAVQGIMSTNVPAYSNENDDFISFEGFYVHGIFTGFKWQCVEFARRWLLLRKSCIFQNVMSAADMWQELTYIERVTDGEKFSIRTYSNGCTNKPKCDSFLIYHRGNGIPYGHIAVICEVQENFICVAEQNYQFHYWPNNYARQIPLIHRNGLYYIEDNDSIYGWMEIESNDQLQPLNQSNTKLILKKYQQSKSIGKLERCHISNKTIDGNYSFFFANDRKRKSCMLTNYTDGLYYKADEDFFVNISNTSNELYRLFMQAADCVIHNNELLTCFGIPEQFWSRIRQSWTDKHEFNIIDHFNFKFDGNELKLCLHKTDSALTVLKPAVAQEKLTQTMNLDYDFTSNFQLHRLLVRNWKRLNIQTTIHILIDNEQEEMATALYMKSVMTEVGINSKLCIIPNDLRWKNSTIVDKDGDIVRSVWKL
jgi:trypanothione synthetase/amidase